MTVIRLRHVEKHTAHDGVTRYYFRYKRGTRVRLPGLPGSKAFMDAYQGELAKADPGSRRNVRSFNALTNDYFRSPKFLKLALSSQQVTRRILNRFLAEHGHRGVAGMEYQDIERIVGAKADTPAAANNLRKKLAVLLRYAIQKGWRETNPAAAVDRFKEGEHHTWTDGQLAQYEARWSLGTLQRTAYAVHLYTGQRRGSGSRMAWPDYTGKVVRVTPDKGGDKLEIPAHPELIVALRAWGVKDVGPMLPSSTGRPYTVESYGNLMADAIDAAGLPEECVLHGLRKAAARRLAEAGCSTKEIQAITGHKTLAEVERYTRAASQSRLASAAILKLK